LGHGRLQELLKVIEVNSLSDADAPRLCPYCRQDVRYSPIARIVRPIIFLGGGILFVVLIVLIMMKPAG
jgi:hypothetical protein